MVEIKRIKKQPRSELVFEQLKDNIIKQYWPSGTKLPSENELASMLNVSRVSVRAAIQKLIALGILEPRVGEGTFVKSAFAGVYLNSLIPMLVLSQKDMIELLQFRKGLEIVSCELATENATDEEIKELGEIIEQMNRAYLEGNIKQYCLDDFRFHLNIARMSKNSVIEYVLTMLKDPIFMQVEEMNKKVGLGFDYHRGVYESIKNRNSKSACKYMEDCIRDTIDKIKQQQSP